MTENTLIFPGFDRFDFPIIVCDGSGDILFRNRSLRTVKDMRRSGSVIPFLSEEDAENLFSGSAGIVRMKVRKRELCHRASRAALESNTVLLFYRFLQVLPLSGKDMLPDSCLEFVSEPVLKLAFDTPEKKSVREILDSLLRRFSILLSPFEEKDASVSLSRAVKVIRRAVTSFLRARGGEVGLSFSDSVSVGKTPYTAEHFGDFISRCFSLVLVCSRKKNGEFRLEREGDLLTFSFAPEGEESGKTEGMPDFVTKNGDAYSVCTKLVPVPSGFVLSESREDEDRDADISLSAALLLDAFDGII